MPTYCNRDGKIPEAVEKWRSIANISEGIDDELATHAWLSIGILLSKDAQEEAFAAYDKALSSQAGSRRCIQQPRCY